MEKKNEIVHYGKKEDGKICPSGFIEFLDWNVGCIICRQKGKPCPYKDKVFDVFDVVEELKAETKENMKVVEMMVKFGGSFVKKLGSLLETADLGNARKIKETWPDYWAKYREFYDLRQKRIAENIQWMKESREGSLREISTNK